MAKQNKHKILFFLTDKLLNVLQTSFLQQNKIIT